ncbi:MAG: SCO family protein [Geminicoccaceae bacterium]
MRPIPAAALGVLMAGLVAGPAAAHSLKELEADIAGREKYFQALGQGREAPAFALQEADGRTVRLADLRGKVVVLNFIYASCPDLCPLHSERIAELQKMVNQAKMEDRVEFVSITTDPEHDTAAVMKAYGGQHGLDPANWLFLTSGPTRPDETRELARHYGQEFTKGADGIETHGVVTHIIDRDGLWRAKLYGLKFDQLSALTYINALVNDVHSAEPQEKPSLVQRIERFFSSALGTSG